MECYQGVKFHLLVVDIPYDFIKVWIDPEKIVMRLYNITFSLGKSFAGGRLTHVNCISS